MSDIWQTIADAIEKLNEGDIQSYYALIDDDCVYTSGMGVMRGRQAILDGDQAILPQLDNHWRRLDKGPIISGNDAAFWGTFGGTVKATGKSFEMEICNILHVKDGKIVAWESYGDFSKAAEAFAP